MENKSILISGASVAGPALAFWLHRYGFQPHHRGTCASGAAGRIRDRFSRCFFARARTHGASARSAGGKQTRIGAITIVDRNNKKVASMPDGFTSGELEILRGDLAASSTRHTGERLNTFSTTASPRLRRARPV